MLTTFFLFDFKIGRERFIAMGRRLMKLKHLTEEIEKTIEDKAERTKILEGSLGKIMSSTQVSTI